jgi:hypothetical protein
MDSFTTITSTTPAQPEIPIEFENGGGGTVYCVVSQSEEDSQGPLDLEHGGGGTVYCVIA